MTTLAVHRLISVLSRLPGMLLPLGLGPVLVPTGSMLIISTAIAAALLGVALVPAMAHVLGRRVMARNILLGTSVLHVLLLVLLITAADYSLTQRADGSVFFTYAMLTGFAFLTGLTTPPVAALIRHPGWTPGQDVRAVAIGTYREARFDEISFILAAALTALHSVNTHNATIVGTGAVLVTSAVITAIAVPFLASKLTEGNLPEIARIRVLPLFVGAETAQARLLEERNFGSGTAENSFHWKAVYPRIAVLLLGIGAGAAGMWSTALEAAAAFDRAGLYGAILAGAAIAGLLAVGGTTQHVAAWSPRRCRRFLSTLLGAVSTAGFLAAVLIPWAGIALSLIALLSLLIGFLHASVLRDTYRQVARNAPAGALGTAMTVCSFALVIGMTVGLTVAGVLADHLGPGWGALVLLIGSMAVAAIDLTWPDETSRGDTTWVIEPD